jgi:hypothetical protein
MRGTWQTTDSSGTGASVLIAVIVVLVLTAGSGAAAHFARAVGDIAVDIMIAAASLTGLLLAAGISFACWRIRHPRPERTAPWVLDPPAAQRAVQARTAPQIAPPQQLHLHFHGTDPAEVAAIIDNTRKDIP